MKSEGIAVAGVIIVLREWQHEDLGTWAHWMEPVHRWQELDGPHSPLPAEVERAAMLERRRAQIEHGPHNSPPRSLVIAGRQTNALLGTVTGYWESEETHWPAATAIPRLPAWSATVPTSSIPEISAATVRLDRNCGGATDSLRRSPTVRRSATMQHWSAP